MEAEAQKVSDAIDEQLRQEKALLKKQKPDVKVLLLGQSESGKSTTLKRESFDLSFFVLCGVRRWVWCRRGFERLCTSCLGSGALQLAVCRFFAGVLRRTRSPVSCSGICAASWRDLSLPSQSNNISPGIIAPVLGSLRGCFRGSCDSPVVVAPEKTIHHACLETFVLGHCHSLPPQRLEARSYSSKISYCFQDGPLIRMCSSCHCGDDNGGFKPSTSSHPQ